MKKTLSAILFLLCLSLVNADQMRLLQTTWSSGYVCPEGQACNRRNRCAKVCTSHASCQNPNQFCDFQTSPATCWPNTCFSLSDCVGQGTCDWIYNVCRTPDGVCTSNNHCSADQACDIYGTGKCYSACSSNSDCTNGQVCNFAFGGCVNVTVSCLTTSDCQSWEVCNYVTGTCMTEPLTCKEVQWMCPSGQRCSISTGYCEKLCRSHADCWYPNSICDFRSGFCQYHDCVSHSDCEDRWGVSECNTLFVGTCSVQLVPCPDDPSKKCRSPPLQ